MSEINDKATITLNVNGAQAKSMLTDLQRELDKASAKLIQMKKEGANEAAIKKQSKEVDRLKRNIDQMKTAASQVTDVMRNLDKATPRQLENTLKQLRKQFRDIKQGSEAWDQHVAKMKKVQAQLQMVNGQLREHQSLWQRFTNFMNNGAVAIVAAIAAYSGALSKLREYVNTWATMEESIWNSVKYTRMSREEVDKLNDAFKKMDTRLGREQLNLLAQEAGRLGKNTIKDVQEYVEAAQIINVALVDLGEGATQTIAKISNIFGIEQLYGVRDAMLKVGSTVNHLSQNCTASKPYLVNFAQRLAGIGATSKMTIPEIIAFGATLDANGQKVEMSASAISRLIMLLFQKTGTIAKTVGLDVDNFTKTLQQNTTKGIMMFLDALKQVSGGTEATAIAKLSPLFKDLGMDGVRMAQVIATLTQHMGELRWQVGEANKAFNEGKSASNEFEIFNNTAQAKIEKAKYRIHELTVELGQKLSPVLMHFTTTSTMLVKSINIAVDFFVKYKRTITTVVVTILAYTVAVKAAIIAEKLWAATMAVVHAGTTALRLSTIALSAVVSAMSGNFTKAAKAVRILNAAMASSPWGLAIAAVGALVTAIIAYKDRTSEAAAAQKKLSESISRTNDRIKSEQTEIDKAFSALKRAKKGTEEYQKAKDFIIENYGKYLQGLINEKNELINVEAAYLRVSNAARKAAIDRGMKDSKSNLDEDFNKRNDNIVDDLESKLRKYAKNQNDVPVLMQSIRDAINKDGVVGEELRSVIQQSINKGTKVNSYHDIMAEIHKLEDSYTQYDKDLTNLQSRFGAVDNPFTTYSLEQLELMHQDLMDQIAFNKETKKKNKNRTVEYFGGPEVKYTDFASYDLMAGGQIVETILGEANAYLRESQLAEAIKLKKAEAAAAASGPHADEVEPTTVPTSSYVEHETKEEKAAREKAAREVQRIIKEDLKEQKRIRDEAMTKLEEQRNKGEIDEIKYQKRRNAIELKYLKAEEKVLVKHGLDQSAEYAEVARKIEELSTKANTRMKKVEFEDAKRQHKKDVNELEDKFYKSKDVDLMSYEQYLEERDKLDLKFVRRRLKIMASYGLKETAEYEQLIAEREQIYKKMDDRRRESDVKDITELYKIIRDEAEKDYNDPHSASYMDDKGLREKRHSITMEEIRAKMELYRANSKEYQALQEQLQKEEQSYSLEQSKEYADAYGKLFPKDQNKAKYNSEMQWLKLAYERELEFAGDNAEKKLAIEKAYQIARAALAQKYNISPDGGLKKAVADSIKWLESDGGKALTGALSTLQSSMSDLFSGVESLLQADLEARTRAIEKEYSEQVKAAEGNSYKLAKLEKDKERRIAEAKNEANRKMFAMQIIQAIAQTATNALNAYGSAAAIPVVGHILAPIAASMAVAAGAIQIAAIRKQSQASEQQGYAEGGFTGEGGKYEPAGIVHRGEWVASRSLLGNPATRPMIDALEYIQRSNKYGSIPRAYVDSALSAPAAFSRAASAASSGDELRSALVANSEMVSQLRKRLSEPIVPVVTVTGDYGIEKAQRQIDKLRNNARKNK